MKILSKNANVDKKKVRRAKASAQRIRKTGMRKNLRVCETLIMWANVANEMM